MSLTTIFKDYNSFPYATSETTNIPDNNYYGDWAQLVNEEILKVGDNNIIKISYVGVKDGVVMNTGFVTWEYFQNTNVGTPPQTVLNHEFVSGNSADIIWAVSLPAVDPNSPDKAIMDLIVKVNYPGYRVFYTVDSKYPVNIIHGAVQHTFMWDISPGMYSTIPANTLIYGHDEWLPAPDGGIYTTQNVGINIYPTHQAVLNVGGAGLFHGPVLIQKGDSDAIDIESDSNQNFDFRVRNINKNVTRLYIDDQGQMGINTNSPLNTFHAVGSAQITERVSIGAGNLPWAKLHTQGETSDDTAYALRISNSSGENLFSVRNDGLISTDPGGGPGGGGAFIWEVDGDSIVLSTETSGKHVNAGTGGLIVGTNDLTPITSFGTYVEREVDLVSTVDWTDNAQVVSARAISSLIGTTGLWTSVSTHSLQTVKLEDEDAEVDLGNIAFRVGAHGLDKGPVRSFGRYNSGYIIDDPEALPAPVLASVDWTDDTQIVSAKAIHNLLGRSGGDSPWYEDADYVKLRTENLNKLVDLGTYGYRVGGEGTDQSPITSFGRSGVREDQEGAAPASTVNWANDNQVVSAKAIDARLNSQSNSLRGLSDVKLTSENNDEIEPDTILGWTGAAWSGIASPESNSLSRIKDDFTSYKVAIGGEVVDDVDLKIYGNIKLYSGPAADTIQSSPIEITDEAQRGAAIPMVSALLPHFYKKANNNNGITEWKSPGLVYYPANTKLLVKEGKGMLFPSYLGDPSFIPQEIFWIETEINLGTKLPSFGPKYVYVTSHGIPTIQDSPLTNAQVRENIYLGYIIVDKDAVQVVPAPAVAGTGTATVEDYIRFQGDGLSMSGAAVVALDDVSLRKVHIKDGDVFLSGINYFDSATNPNVKPIFSTTRPANSANKFIPITSGGGTWDPIEDLPDHWEDTPGPPSTLSPGKATTHLIFQMPAGSTYMLYGQKEYGSVADAERDLPDYIAAVKVPDGLLSAVLLASTIVKGGDLGIGAVHNRGTASSGGIIPVQAPIEINDGAVDPKTTWSSQKISDDVQFWERDTTSGVIGAKDDASVYLPRDITVERKATFVDSITTGIAEFEGDIAMYGLQRPSPELKLPSRTYLTSLNGAIILQNSDDIKADLQMKLVDLQDVTPASSHTDGNVIIYAGHTFQERALKMEDLEDVDVSILDSGSILSYENGKWTSSKPSYVDPGDFDSVTPKTELLDKFYTISKLTTDTQGRITEIQSTDLNSKYAKKFDDGTYDLYEKWNLHIDGGFGSSHFEMGSNNKFKITAGANMRFDIDEDINELTLINTVSDTDTYINGADFDIHSGVITLHNSDGGTVPVNIDDRYADKIHKHVEYDAYGSWNSVIDGTSVPIMSGQDFTIEVSDPNVQLKWENGIAKIGAVHNHSIGTLEGVEPASNGEVLTWNAQGGIANKPISEIQTYTVKVSEHDTPGFLMDKMSGTGITITDDGGKVKLTNDVQIDDSAAPSTLTVYSSKKMTEITSTSSKGITYSVSYTSNLADLPYKQGEEAIVEEVNLRPVYRATVDKVGTGSEGDWKFVYNMNEGISGFLPITAVGAPGTVYMGNEYWANVPWSTIAERPTTLDPTPHKHDQPGSNWRVDHQSLANALPAQHRDHDKIKLTFEKDGGVTGDAMPFGLVEGEYLIKHKGATTTEKVEGSGAIVVNRLTQDKYGHISSLGSTNLTEHYKSNPAELPYLDRAGGTMGGKLFLSDGSQAASNLDVKAAIGSSQLEDLADVEPGVTNQVLTWGSGGKVLSVSKESLDSGMVKVDHEDTAGYLKEKMVGEGITITQTAGVLKLDADVKINDGGGGSTTTVYSSQKVDELSNTSSKGIRYSWNSEIEKDAQVDYDIGEEGIILKWPRPVYRASVKYPDPAEIVWEYIYDMDSSSTSYLRTDDAGGAGTVYTGGGEFKKQAWADIEGQPAEYKAIDHKHTADDGGRLNHGDLVSKADQHQDHSKILLSIGPGLSGINGPLLEGTHEIRHEEITPKDGGHLSTAQVIQALAFDARGHISEYKTQDMDTYYTDNPDRLPYIPSAGGTISGEITSSDGTPLTSSKDVGDQLAKQTLNDLDDVDTTGAEIGYVLSKSPIGLTIFTNPQLTESGKIKMDLFAEHKFLGDVIDGSLEISTSGELKVKTPLAIDDTENPPTGTVASAQHVQRLLKSSSKGIKYSWATEADMQATTGYIAGEEGVLNTGKRPVYRASKSYDTTFSMGDWYFIYNMDINADIYLLKTDKGADDEVYMGGGQFGHIKYTELLDVPGEFQTKDHTHSGVAASGGKISHEDLSAIDQKKHQDHAKISIDIGDMMVNQTTGAHEKDPITFMEGSSKIGHKTNSISDTSNTKARVINNVKFDGFGHISSHEDLDVTDYYNTKEPTALDYLRLDGTRTMEGELILSSHSDGSNPDAATPTRVVDTKISNVELGDLRNVTLSTKGGTVLASDDLGNWTNVELDSSTIGALPDDTTMQIVGGESIQVDETLETRLAGNPVWHISHKTHDYRMDLLPGNKVISKLSFDGHGHIVRIDTKDIGFSGVADFADYRMITATSDKNKLQAHNTLTYKRDEGMYMTLLSNDTSRGLHIRRETAGGAFLTNGETIGAITVGGSGLEAVAFGPQSGTINGSHLHIVTVPENSNKGIRRISITSDGNVEINPQRSAVSTTIFKPETSTGDRIALMVDGKGDVGINTQEAHSTLTIKGSVSAGIRHAGDEPGSIINTTYIVQDDDHTVICDHVWNVKFIEPRRFKGRIIYVKAIGKQVTVTSEHAESFFDSAPRAFITIAAGKTIMFQSDGTYWQYLNA